MPIDIAKIQEALFAFMLEIDAVCTKHHLEYALIAGSALGAVRHKGFIPWDDDLDICMTRENSRKLKSVLQHDYSESFFYQDSDTDPFYCMPFAKIRKNNTTFIEQGEEAKQYHQGLFIDIFEVDGAHKSRLKNKKANLSALLYEAYLRDIMPENPLKKAVLRGIKLFLPRDKALVSCKKSITAVPATPGTNVRVFYLFYHGNQPVIPYDLFFPARRVAFSDGSLPVPNRVKDYLTLQYGDYLQVPPEQDRLPSHISIFDMNKNYTEYINA